MREVLIAATGLSLAKDLGWIQPLARLGRANSAGTVTYGVPFLIAQNPKDDLVASAVTRTYAKALWRSGARVRYLSITDRFAGRPAPSDCRRF